MDFTVFLMVFVLYVMRYSSLYAYAHKIPPTLAQPTNSTSCSIDGTCVTTSVETFSEERSLNFTDPIIFATSIREERNKTRWFLNCLTSLHTPPLEMKWLQGEGEDVFREIKPSKVERSKNATVIVIDVGHHLPNKTIRCHVRDPSRSYTRHVEYPCKRINAFSAYKEDCSMLHSDMCKCSCRNDSRIVGRECTMPKYIAEDRLKKTAAIIVGVLCFAILLLIYITLRRKKALRVPQYAVRSPSMSSTMHHVNCNCHLHDKPPSYEDIINEIEPPPPYPYPKADNEENVVDVSVNITSEVQEIDNRSQSPPARPDMNPTSANECRVSIPADRIENDSSTPRADISVVGESTSNETDIQNAYEGENSLAREVASNQETTTNL